MAQNVTIAGASYSNVPSVDIPKTGGGTVRFYDVQGSQTITENGTYDITTIASAVVDVPGGGGGATNTKVLDVTIASDVAVGAEVTVYTGDTELASHYSDTTMTAFIFPTSAIDAAAKNKQYVYGCSSNRDFFINNSTHNNGMFILINSATTAQTISDKVQYKTKKEYPCVAINSNGNVIVRAWTKTSGFSAGQYRIIFNW